MSGTYAVVGCSDCECLWVVETDVDSTGCPRCGRRHQFDRLKQFVRTDSIEAAREGRASLLAARAGETATFERFRERSDVASAVETPVVEDAEYLEAAGIDPDTVEGAEAGTTSSESRGHQAVIEEAVATVEPATTSSIVAYAVDNGMAAETAREVLERMRREGLLAEESGTYRRV